MFPKPVPKIHVGFEDPDGKGFEAFEATYREIEEILLPKLVEALK
jgi:arsenate reductase